MDSSGTGEGDGTANSLFADGRAPAALTRSFSICRGDISVIIRRAVTSLLFAVINCAAMIFDTPTHYFVCAGQAEGYSPLNAFDQALIDAGVGDLNLVRLSSILPPRCKKVEPFELPGGALVPVAYSKMYSSTPGEVISAAVAIAIPEDGDLPGLIMEHHGAGPLSEVLEQVHEMAIQGMGHRRRAVADVLSVGESHKVERHGAVFAGVVMWNGARG